MQIDITPWKEVDLPWPHYGTELLSKLKDDLGGVTFSDSCQNRGCMLGTSLVFNIKTLRRQLSDSSNATTLRGTQDFIASVVDNTLINRLLTRLVSEALEPTEEVSVIIGVRSVLLGDYKFVLIVCVLNTVIIAAYLVEFLRTWAWTATPAFDIMNDSEVIVAAFEGGRVFEKSMKHTSLPHVCDERLSEKSMLSLEYDVSHSGKPIILPHTMGLEYVVLPIEEHSTDITYTPSIEHIPPCRETASMRSGRFGMCHRVFISSTKTDELKHVEQMKDLVAWF
jgi:hypothetical protein